jgi:hypothetical protein
VAEVAQTKAEAQRVVAAADQKARATILRHSITPSICPSVHPSIPPSRSAYTYATNGYVQLCIRLQLTAHHTAGEERAHAPHWDAGAEVRRALTPTHTTLCGAEVKCGCVCTHSAE